MTNPQFFNDAVARDVPRNTIPREPMPASAAYQLVMDEAMLDGNARLNLATFVTTWMDEEADKIYAAAADKNMIDKDEYPQTAAIEKRCAEMVARLWHAPEPNTTVGVSTVGSSEACMLGRARTQTPLATRSQSCGKRRQQAEPGDEFGSAGRMGEVLQLLGHRGAVRADLR